MITATYLVLTAAADAAKKSGDLSSSESAALPTLQGVNVEQLTEKHFQAIETFWPFINDRLPMLSDEALAAVPKLKEIEKAVMTSHGARTRARRPTTGASALDSIANESSTASVRGACHDVASGLPSRGPRCAPHP